MTVNSDFISTFKRNKKKGIFGEKYFVYNLFWKSDIINNDKKDYTGAENSSFKGM